MWLCLCLSLTHTRTHIPTRPHKPTFFPSLPLSLLPKMTTFSQENGAQKGRRGEETKKRGGKEGGVYTYIYTIPDCITTGSRGGVGGRCRNRGRNVNKIKQEEHRLAHCSGGAEFSPRCFFFFSSFFSLLFILYGMYLFSFYFRWIRRVQEEGG